MIGKYHYTGNELNKMLKSMIILIDTREKQNAHITDYLDECKISHRTKKMNFGDYSLMLPADVELGIMKDIYFDESIAIERKNSLEELSSNLTSERARFESELLRSHGAKLLLMIENANYEDIVNHKYNTQYEPNSFLATLKTYEARFNLGCNFIPSQYSGSFICRTFYYQLREYLKYGA